MTDMTWSQTRTGLRWDVLNPQASAVNWWDIATALSNLCRFNGHTCRFYSVAEHSVHVHDVVAASKWAAPVRLFALLHDAHEAYLGDLTTPVANAMAAASGPAFRGGWTHLRSLHDHAIFTAAGLEPPGESAHTIVKAADLAVLMTERDVLMGAPPEPWGDLENVRRADVTLSTWTPSEARWQFLRRLHELAPHLIFPDGGAE